MTSAPGKPLARTVPALLAEMTARAPQAPFVCGQGQRFSYAEFAAAVMQTARALHAAGVRAGDRVGILMGNRPEWLLVDFAVMQLGAIAVGLNTWATAHELSYQLGHAGVKLLFIEPQFRASDLVALVNEARAAGAGLPALEAVICIADTAPAGTQSYADFMAGAARVTPETVAAMTARITENHVACLLYTSGSTALPKGVPLKHGGLIDNMWEIGERQHLGRWRWLHPQKHHADCRKWLGDHDQEPRLACQHWQQPGGAQHHWRAHHRACTQLNHVPGRFRLERFDERRRLGRHPL
ncbi:MAG: hypothetical protein EBU07_17775, partial [Betaproteobacteria bacterium]|nr:hypothetical protein [Betaproteobacteria bacterium]